MTTTFSGHVLITHSNLNQLPKLLQKRGSGLLAASANHFPACPVLMDLFIDPKVDVKKSEIYSASRRGDLTDRHYRLVGAAQRTNPLSLLFTGLEVDDATFIISYQSSIRQGFLHSDSLLYVESQRYVPAAVTYLLANFECVRSLKMTDGEYKGIEEYIASDLSTKAELKKNIVAGQAADNMLGIF
jgi:hypothetical protein